MLSAPARAGTWGLRKIVGAGFQLFTKAVSAIVGGQMLADASAFVQAFDSMFGGFRERADRTYRLLRSRGTAFVVVAAPEPDALREAGYFVQRLSEESMPLSGLVVNRTHPTMAKLTAAKALAAADNLERNGESPLAAAVLRLHADRVAVTERERRLVGRFTRTHPEVALAMVPALPSDVHDLDGLRDIGEKLGSRPQSDADQRVPASD
jgi:anion-transporting  ArsA/GET3 family ATPase